MSRQRRNHGPEFKREAVALVVARGYSCADAGRSLGVNGSLIGRWKRELENHAVEAFPGKGKRTPEQQRIYELETENRRLRMEKEILKKATVRSMGQCNTLYSGKERRSVIHGVLDDCGRQSDAGSHAENTASQPEHFCQELLHVRSRLN